MTADPNGWPDASKPGVPLHPERNGQHWLHHPEDIRPIVQPWDAEHASWISGAMHSPQGVADLGFRYLGPCLLPEEVAAREAAAAEAMREARREGMEALLLDIDAIEANLPTIKARDYPDDMGRLLDDVRAAIRAAMGGETR